MTFYEDEIRSPDPGRRSRGGAARAGRLDVSGVAHVAGADAVSRAELAELVVGRPVRRAPGAGGPSARLLARLVARRARCCARSCAACVRVFA